MKIAICVPHYGPLKAQFVSSLAGLLTATAAATIAYNGAPTQPEIATLFEEDGPLEYKRTRLVKRALAWDADYVQWIDSDQTFPPGAIFRLAGHDLPVVGCNYLSKGNPAHPTALDLSGGRIVTTADKAAGPPEIVGAVGLGFCLVKAPLFERIPMPWFASDIDDQGNFVTGEDVHFCNQVRRAGLSVHLDHGLSMEIGHVAETVRMNTDLGARADAADLATRP